MVRAFRRLCETGLEGWELHLVGGCSDDGRSYLDMVRSEAAGLPVVIHANATGAELRGLYGAASIFWSLTGLGENERKDPVRFEHFGITTVEAMSAGAVPIVLRAGGQVEIVRPEREGLLVDDHDDVVAATRRVALDDDLRGRLSAAARTRAEHFAMPEFAARFRAVVDDVLSAK
jgi:glycosyltransferase involved in cell wall biosynthesis